MLDSKNVEEIDFEEFKENYANSNDTANDENDSDRFDYRKNVLSAADLLDKKFPEPKYAVEGILSEGLTVFAAKPKMGKTWCGLGIAIAVASGGYALGKIPVEQGDALYLALEDGARRLQSRLRILLDGSKVPERLDIATSWRRLNEGGLNDIEGWLSEHPEARLIVIDTLKRVRTPERRAGRIYDEDYDSVSSLADLAKEYGVSVLVIHHTRKQDSDDPLDLISGSFGLSGGSDGALVLKRARGQADGELFTCNRDFDEKQLAVKWDSATCQWVIVGDAEEFRLSEERRAIVELLRKSSSPMTPKEIADTLGRNGGAVRKMLLDMRSDGQVVADAKNRYSLPPKVGNNGNKGNGKTPMKNSEPLFANSSVTDVTDVTEGSYCNFNEIDINSYPDANEFDF